jgi:micrococcal nuclease
MMRLANLLLVLVLLPLSAAAAPPAGAPPPGATPATLVTVIDGDTIDVSIAGKVERVRYVAVAAPERGQPGFEAATEANRTLLQAGALGAGPLYLVREVSDRDKTSDRRLLRYVYTADGTLVERELVARGFAQPVEYPPDTRFAKEFRQLAVQAAQKRLGFWSSPPPDLDCPEISYRNFRVIGSDPHRFDGDHDGIGCEK